MDYSFGLAVVLATTGLLTVTGTVTLGFWMALAKFAIVCKTVFGSGEIPDGEFDENPPRSCVLFIGFWTVDVAFRLGKTGGGGTPKL